MLVQEHKQNRNLYYINNTQSPALPTPTNNRLNIYIYIYIYKITSTIMSTICYK